MCSSKQKLALSATLLILGLAAGCTGFFVNPTLSSLAIGPQNQTITNSRTLQLTATGTFSDGSTKDLTSKVIWSSGTPTCATINSTGLLTPAATVSGVCNTTVSAAFGTITPATTTVSVSAGTPTSITLTASTTTPAPNSSVTFKALATFPNSSTQQDITSSVTWINSDTTDLTLTNGSGTGTVSASAAASTAINVAASFGGVNSNTVTLTVQ
ncbi:MAG: Ig-like domain-containing protein [Acidobacteria bacterium]|nr:Ig-like domain-containing protein [Acidobacteriota bacterium]MBV9626033.1 Ig-like domain-containing protein [Acidobacteriota bacterium]